MYIATRHNKVIHYCESGYIVVGSTLICEAEKLALDSAICVEVDAVPTDIDKYDYFYVEGIFVKEDKKILHREIVISEYAQYAEVAKWNDDNSSNEVRVGYFVSFDTAGSDSTTIKKASQNDEIVGVSISNPGFATKASFEKYDTNGKLLKKYAYITTSGTASVIDDGSCIVGGRCMPNNNGIASVVEGNYGYLVLNRIDATHVTIMVTAEADSLYRLNTTKASCNIPITLNVTSDGILQIIY